MHFAAQNTPAEALQRMRDHPTVVNDDGGPCVGGANHGPLQLQGAHAADLQVLVYRQGVAKPANVAEVHQHGGCLGGVGKPCGQFLAKQVFVADVGCNALPLPLERGLPHRAPVEVAQRNVQHFGEPLEQRRDEFAKWHQMVLVIDVGWLGRRPRSRAPAQHRIGVALTRIAQRYAEQGRLIALGVAGLQPLQVAGNQLLGQQRNGGFRRHHKRRGFAAQLLGIPGQRQGYAAALFKFFVLRNIALQQRQLQWRLRRLRGGVAQLYRAMALHPGKTSCPQQHQCYDPGTPVAQIAPAALHQRHGQPRRNRAHAIHPHHPRQGRQGPLHVGIAPRAPREAGEPGAAQQLGQQPQCCKKHSCQRFIGGR